MYIGTDLKMWLAWVANYYPRMDDVLPRLSLGVEVCHGRGNYILMLWVPIF